MHRPVSYARCSGRILNSGVGQLQFSGCKIALSPIDRPPFSYSCAPHFGFSSQPKYTAPRTNLTFRLVVRRTRLITPLLSVGVFKCGICECGFAFVSTTREREGRSFRFWKSVRRGDCFRRVAFLRKVSLQQDRGILAGHHCSSFLVAK